MCSFGGGASNIADAANELLDRLRAIDRNTARISLIENDLEKVGSAFRTKSCSNKHDSEKWELVFGQDHARTTG
jgi:hypothetical protein